MNFLAVVITSVLVFTMFINLPTTKISATAADRYTVLVLDSSGSMSGTPIIKQREAATKFCNDILNADGNNYIALVALGSYASVKCDFTKDINKITTQISKITADSGTNYGDALSKAGSLLKNVDASNIRNIVFCSDGLPEYGEQSADGPYTKNDNSYSYAYANKAQAIADELKKEYNIYTLGFFHGLKGNNLIFGKKVMEGIASNPSQYYDVTDPNQLIFTFGDVAENVLTKDNDPIILIPGIMGSRLFLDEDCGEDQCAWPPNGGSSLHLNVDDNLSGELYVKSPEKQNNLTSSQREYGAQECMKKLVDSMCTKFPERDIYVFSYDWRKTNAISADKLNEFINSLGVNKVDIVAHSMGGLVTSKYYKEYGNSKVDKIITCGTPYEGAPKLIDAVQNWNVTNNFTDVVLGLSGLQKDVKSSFDGVAQLTPTRNYISVMPMQKDSKKWFSIGDYDLTYDQYADIMKEIFTTERYNNAVDFQESLHDSTGYNALLSYENAYFLVGTDHKTITAVKFQYSNNELDEIMYESDLDYTTKGDGTVPYLSASMLEHINNLPDERHTTINCNHAQTITNTNALLWIQGILESEIPVIEASDNNGHPYMVIRIACPVDVVIADGDQALSSVKGAESFKASFGRLDIIGEDNDIKMVCMDENTNLDVKLDGTGTGTMTYTIRHYSADDVLLDERTFENVPITEDTVIQTKADNAETTILNVDKDGDGIVDETWTTSKNEIVTVSDTDRVPMNGIEASIDNSNLKVGDVAKISVEKNPVTSTDNMNITLSSNNENVVTVDSDGVVKAVGVGTAIIKISSSNGFVQELTLTVAESGQIITTTVINVDSPKTGDTTPFIGYLIAIFIFSNIVLITRKTYNKFN